MLPLSGLQAVSVCFVMRGFLNAINGESKVLKVCVCVGVRFLKPLGPIAILRSSVRWSPHSGHGSGLCWHPAVQVYSVKKPVNFGPRFSHLHFTPSRSKLELSMRQIWIKSAESHDGDEF